MRGFMDSSLAQADFFRVTHVTLPHSVGRGLRAIRENPAP